MAVQPLGTAAEASVPVAQKPVAQKPVSQKPVSQKPVTQKPVTREIIVYGGRRFSCTPEMARIFLKHAREVIESGEEQLVPLLHSGGIELLLVSRATPYSLLDPALDPAEG